jgi:hypothetical protein
MQSLKDLGYGIRRHPWKTLGYIFTCFSILFTIVKALVQFIPGIKIEGPFALSILILISLAYGLGKVWKPSKQKITIANCNTIIELVFADLFEQDGIRAIAVSEFFESELGKPVSDKSLHGVFLQRCFGSHPESLDAQLQQQLSSVQGTPVAKTVGKDICYPIGTTAIVNVNQDVYLLFALTKTEASTCKVYSDVELMWRALHKLWQRARIECGGHPLNLPLVGSGLSGLGLPTRDLLNLLILSAITETKATEITQTIRVVLRRDRFEHVDLREVKAHWEE